MLEIATNSSSPTPSALDAFRPQRGVPTLFRHTRREAWGLAIVLRKLDDRVRMQFQDGRSRTFKEGYYHLMDAVDRPLDLTMSVVRALESMTDELEKSAEDKSRTVSMDEQLVYFREQFPEGFQSEEYEAHHRGSGRKKPLKRHRDALVEEAEALSLAHMRAMLRDRQFTAVFDAAAAIVNVTDLVAAKERKRFCEMETAHHEAFAMSLNALLFGSSKLSVRFDAFVRTLEAAIGKNPSWGLATIFLGATQPTKFVVVRERVLSLQGRWMAPGLAVPEHPVGILFERLTQMTEGVRDRLKEGGLEPRDLLDVTDFMWATLRPKAQARIAEMRFERGLDFASNPSITATASAEAA